jgi:AcrR family transcriptional regulator
LFYFGGDLPGNTPICEDEMGTKQAILDTALELFNHQGTAPISTNHIAQALGISPGNLYYHFRNKEQIIQALFERLFNRWDAAFRLPENKIPEMEDLLHLLRLNFDILWEYRFAYRELGALLRQDPELQARYLEVRQRGFEGFHELFAFFVQAEVLDASSSPEDVTEMAELCWLISEYWLPNLEQSGREYGPQEIELGIQLIRRVLRA